MFEEYFNLFIKWITAVDFHIIKIIFFQLLNFIGNYPLITSIIYCILMFLGYLKYAKRIKLSNVELKKNIDEDTRQYLINSEKNIINIYPDAIVEKYYNYLDSHNHIPGRFTAFGIMGTFIGIMLGIIPLDLTNAEKMQEAITTLIGGMSIAFISSICGIALSVRFSRLLKNNQQKIDNELESIKEKYTVETPQLYLREQFKFTEEQQKTSQALREAAEVLGSSTGNLKDLLNPEKMAEIISTSLSNVITSELRPTFESIDKKFVILEDIKTASVELKETNRVLAKYITEDLQKVFDSITQSLTASREAIDRTNEAISETNTTMIATRSSLEQQNKNFTKIDDMLNTFVDRMKTVLDENTNHSVQLLQETQARISEVIDSSNEKLQSTLKGVGEELVKTSDKVRDELAKFRDEYTTSLDRYLENQGELLDKTMGNHVERLRNVTDDLGQQLQQDFENRTQISNTLLDLVEKVGRLVAEQKTIEAIGRDQLENIATTVSEYHNGLFERLAEFTEKHQDGLYKYQEIQDQNFEKILGYMAGLLEGIHVSAPKN